MLQGHFQSAIHPAPTSLQLSEACLFFQPQWYEGNPSPKKAMRSLHLYQMQRSQIKTMLITFNSVGIANKKFVTLKVKG